MVGKSFKPIRISDDSTIDLFCFPYAGSGASIFYSWANHLNPKINIYGFQAPGKEDRISEDLIIDLNILIQNAVQELKQIINKPFVLFGHSMGSVLAFEIAKSLESENITPKLVILSGRPPPKFGLRMNPISHLGDKELITELYKLEGTDTRILENDELMELLLPIIRADFRISEAYQSSASLKINSPMIAIGSEEDPWLNEAEFNDWKDYSNSTTKIQFFPGGHFYLREHLDLLSTFLNTEILAQV
jgi:surfactin synthase thioesterase subunit